ncbi:MAG TPA: CGNR zinc finger domain-containing protein [Candidatus Limnocylindrales bacterium]|nr:CGNR zinc finger domain-containing protein [Candidatus Limnocylindrales bacterium]
MDTSLQPPHLLMEDSHAVPHGHQAALQDGLDFVNTLELEKGQPIDRLPDLPAALGWLREHDLIHPEAMAAEIDRGRDQPEAEARTLRRVTRLRAAMRALVEASVERRPPTQEALTEVNRSLRTHYVYVLVPAPDGVSLDHRHEGDPVEGALARLAESLARELSQGDVERLRICANPSCAWAFFDTSRTGRRKWCNMSTCGNRAKAARHRERLKEAVQAAG